MKQVEKKFHNISFDGSAQRLDTWNMNLRRELEKKIEKKRDEIAQNERTLAESRAYLQALEDTLRLLPKDDQSDCGTSLERSLRAGSDMAKIEAILKEEGKPLHIDELMRRIGKDEKYKISLSGSLSSYVRMRRVFTRPNSNTFGLIEFEKAKNEPPGDFGILKAV